MDIRTILIDHGIESKPVGTIEGNFDQLTKRITDLDQYVGGAFRDGVISEMEAKKIQVYVNLLSETNKQIKERYDALYNHVDLEEGYTKDELYAANLAYDTTYQKLLEDISMITADMRATPEESEKVDKDYLALIDTMARLEKAMQSASDAIIGKRSKEAEENAKEYARVLKGEILETTSELDQRLAATEGYIDGSFRDGIVSEVEAQRIKTYLESLALQKTQLDKKYEEIYSNYFLSGDPKLNLLDAKQKYDAKHSGLVQLINTAIADSVSTPEESDDVRQGFVELDTALALLVSCFEKAAEQLSQARANAAEKQARDYADEQIGDIKNNIVYKVEILSSKGLAFKNGVFDTTLEARVYHGATDVTDQFNAARFRWKRVSNDSEGDRLWNISNAGGTKSVRITPGDIKVRATFTCSIYEDGTTDTTPPNVVTNLRVTNATSTSVELTWDESTTNDVSGYEIYEGSTLKGFTYDNKFTVNSLQPDTTYTFTVVTRDMAGNVSTTGMSKTVTTWA